MVVSGLPPTGSWQDLKDHLREAGDVCYADVYKDGTGIVEFLRYEDMKYAVKKLDDSRFRSHEGEVAYVRVREVSAEFSWNSLRDRGSLTEGLLESLLGSLLDTQNTQKSRSSREDSSSHSSTNSPYLFPHLFPSSLHRPPKVAADRDPEATVQEDDHRRPIRRRGAADRVRSRDREIARVLRPPAAGKPLAGSGTRLNVIISFVHS